MPLTCENVGGNTLQAAYWFKNKKYANLQEILELGMPGFKVEQARELAKITGLKKDEFTRHCRNPADARMPWHMTSSDTSLVAPEMDEPQVQLVHTDTHLGAMPDIHIRRQWRDWKSEILSSCSIRGSTYGVGGSAISSIASGIVAS
jgi:hypothetical protein